MHITGIGIPVGFVRVFPRVRVQVSEFGPMEKPVPVATGKGFATGAFKLRISTHFLSHQVVLIYFTTTHLKFKSSSKLIDIFTN